MSMTAKHKEALAQGRAQSRAVQAYLAALKLDGVKRPTRTPEEIETRLASIRAEYETVTPIKQLQLIQERMDLEAELKKTQEHNGSELETAEANFIEHAKSYGSAKGISYAAWREIGIAASVLHRAGITR